MEKQTKHVKQWNNDLLVRAVPETYFFFLLSFSSSGQLHFCPAGDPEESEGPGGTGEPDRW